jgi:addiction module HigA family antidote
MPIRAVHSGEILKEELAALSVSPTALARQIAVLANRVHQIVAGKRAVTGDTALRLGHWFGPIRSSGSVCKVLMRSKLRRKGRSNDHVVANLVQTIKKLVIHKT